MLKNRFKFFFLGGLFGLFSLLIQARFFPVIFRGKLDPSLIFGLILWLGFFKRNPEGVLLSFILAWLQGAISGNLSGVFLFTGMSLYLLSWLLRERFAPRSGLEIFAFALALSVFYKLVLIVSLEIFVGRGFFRVQSLGYLVLEIFLNAIFALLVFAFFRRVKGFFDLLPEEVELRRY